MSSTAEAFKYKKSACDMPHDFKSTNTKVGWSDAAPQRDIHLGRLGTWQEAFQDLLITSPSHSNEDERIRVAKLCVSYNTILILLSMCLSRDETAYDHFLPNFAEIIHHSTSFSNAYYPRREQKRHQRRQFDMEMSII
jgi:hypothetical protein